MIRFTPEMAEAVLNEYNRLNEESAVIDMLRALESIGGLIEKQLAPLPIQVHHHEEKQVPPTPVDVRSRALGLAVEYVKHRSYRPPEAVSVAENVFRPYIETGEFSG